MKKILITGSFEGSVGLVYGEDGIGADTYPPLLEVDFSGAVITDVQKDYLMNRIPARYGPGFEQAFTTKLKVIMEEMEPDFEADFFKPYGKAINKARCEKEWNRMGVADRGLTVARLPAYLRYLARTGVAKADPENYLKKKYYKNDYDNL
jgi:hypothetical protein